MENIIKWECDICDYIHEGENPPEICPTCGYSKEHFHKVKA